MLTYLLKTAVIQCVLLLCYRLLIQRDTFYNMTRYYFMGGLVFSYIAPFIHFDFRVLPPMQDHIVQLPQLVQPTIIHDKYMEQLSHTTVQWWQQYSFTDILTAVFVTGMVFMLIRCMIQYSSLVRLHICQKDKYQSYSILNIDEPIKPFSFGRRIYINTKLHNAKELDEIIRHELVHIRQSHSLDIIVATVNNSIFWWNPFAWILNGDIRNNLEYIVDNEMLQNGTNRKHYQYHLLNINQLIYKNNIVNYFNFSNFKKRIEMMNKEKTQPVYKIKWLLLPLVATVILLMFNMKRAIATNVDFAVNSGIIEPEPAIPVDTAELYIWCDSASTENKTKPLILIDGKEAKSDDLTKLKSEDIHALSILKHDSATHVYIKQGKNGMIIVKTKQCNDSVYVGSHDGLTTNAGLASTNCLVIIDGKETGNDELSKLKSTEIHSITVLKGDAAIKTYDEKGKNGVIIVETKNKQVKSD